MRNIVLTSVLVLAAGSANAGESYVNVGSTQFNTAISNTVSATGKIGANINKYLGVEAEAGYGISGVNLFGIKAKQNADIGAYAVASAPLNDKFSLIGRVGYHHTWAEVGAFGLKAQADKGNYVYGVGAQMMLDEKNGVRADFTRAFENNGIDKLGLSYVRKF